MRRTSPATSEEATLRLVNWRPFSWPHRGRVGAFKFQCVREFILAKCGLNREQKSCLLERVYEYVEQSQTKLTFSFLAEFKILTETLWLAGAVSVSLKISQKISCSRAAFRALSQLIPSLYRRSLNSPPYLGLTNFSHSEYKLTEALRLVDFCLSFNSAKSD